ncbi:unnamed protein product [Parajaminaea phylloscopi]
MSAPQVPADLPRLLADRYETAIARGSAYFYPSEVHTVEDRLEDNGEVTLQWSIRRCEALRQKAKEKRSREGKAQPHSTEAGSKPTQGSSNGQNPDDVFAPPYDSNLLVAELGDHTLLLNKFALIPQHFLLVTRDFRSQALPPAPATLALSYRILTSLPSSSADQRLCFFNCGPDSGASQPHCHMQFVDLSAGGGVLVERLLDRIERDGKETMTVHALPLPYQHFVHLLPPSLASSSDVEGTLAQALMRLLDAMFSARSAAADGPEAATPKTRGQTSWNLLLTQRAMHLIPRDREEYPLHEAAQSDGEADSDEVGPLSLNALCFAGHLVTKSNEEISRIRSHAGGVKTILSSVARKPVLDYTVASLGPEGHGP